MSFSGLSRVFQETPTIGLQFRGIDCLLPSRFYSKEKTANSLNIFFPEKKTSKACSQKSVKNGKRNIWVRTIYLVTKKFQCLWNFSLLSESYESEKPCP